MIDAREFQIRPTIDADRAWIQTLIDERWSAPFVVSRGQIYWPDQLPAFVAERGGQPCGLLTFHIKYSECEIVTLDSLVQGIGIGSALMDAVHQFAAQAGCRKLWLITTNDNLPALRFYQKRGFHLVAVHCDAIEATRAIKPGLSRLGMDGIPLRDELELERLLIKDR